MKKRIAVLLAVVLCLSLMFACADSRDDSSPADEPGSSVTDGNTKPGGQNGETEKDDRISVLADPKFSQGFYIRGTDSAVDGNGAKATVKLGDGDIVWNVGQWYSRYDLSESQPVVTAGRVSVSDTSKKVTLNRHTGEITLELAASEEYDTAASSRAKWAHLLVEQEFTEFSSRTLDTLSKVEVALDFRVTAIKSEKETAPTSKAMPAQFLQFFYVVNRNLSSAGYGDFMWFGLGYLDTREECKELSYLQDFAGGTAGNFIYSLGAKETLGEGAFEFGKEYKVNIDILPYISAALKKAKECGFMTNTKLSDCVLTGMNLGWEVVGIWDVSSSIKNLSVKATVKD